MDGKVYQRRAGGAEVVLLKLDETHVTLRQPSAQVSDFVLPRRTFEEDFVILGGEDLDRAVDRAMGGETVTGPTLEARLADCLADAIDTPVMKVRDTMGGPEIELRLGAWLPEISERAAELLEEAGR